MSDELEVGAELAQTERDPQRVADEVAAHVAGELTIIRENTSMMRLK